MVGLKNLDSADRSAESNAMPKGSSHILSARRFPQLVKQQLIEASHAFKTHLQAASAFIHTRPLSARYLAPIPRALVALSTIEGLPLEENAETPLATPALSFIKSATLSPTP